MTDRIREMQRRIEKNIKAKERMAEQTTNAKPPKGLLARKTAKPMQMAEEKNDPINTVAEYIMDLRKFKQEVLNGKKTTV